MINIMNPVFLNPINAIKISIGMVVFVFVKNHSTGLIMDVHNAQVEVTLMESSARLDLLINVKDLINIGTECNVFVFLISLK